MAGGSAKKVTKQNNSRLQTLRNAILGSEVVHLGVRLYLTRSVMNLHPASSWYFLAFVNLCAWLSYCFLASLSSSGNTLVSVSAGGGKSTKSTKISSSSNAPVAWWIENLQDFVFLCAGANFFATSSIKAAAMVLSLAPLYMTYLVLRLLKNHVLPNMFPPLFEGPEGALRHESDDHATMGTRGMKKNKQKRVPISKNKTR